MSIWHSNSKEKVDDWMTLDAGLLKPKSRGGLPKSATVEWHNNGRLIDKIHIQKNAHFIQLRFDELVVTGGSWRPTNQQIDVESTSCHYGGNRSWFKCPTCAQRVGLIARKQRLFACRKCHDLVYRSQYQTEYERLLTLQRKIKKRIFQSDGKSHIRVKKKGVHWTTYNRLHDRYTALELDLYTTAEKILDFKM